MFQEHNAKSMEWLVPSPSAFVSSSFWSVFALQGFQIYIHAHFFFFFFLSEAANVSQSSKVSGVIQNKLRDGSISPSETTLSTG